MTILTVGGFFCIAFVIAWRFEDTLLGVFPFIFCTIGLVLYALAFFRRMYAIDWILIAGGILAVYIAVQATLQEGKDALWAALRRKFCDGHLWVSIIILLTMCFFLKDAQILEWDGYSFWGPDTKSFYYRNGFAPKHSNVALEYGDYPPMSQLIFWWFIHLAGEYNEQYMFFAYYAFGSLLMFSIADRFRMSEGVGRVLTPIFACLGSVVLPGVVCTAWFRAIYVDPLMAMIFGIAISLAVCREDTNSTLYKAKMLVYLMCLTLIKSIGILWSVLALIFFCLWRLKEEKEYRFAFTCAGGVAVCAGSWSVFCRIMERTTYLTNNVASTGADRLAEIKNGVFFIMDKNRRYIVSYAKAFLTTPMHREDTFAIDYTPALFLIILFAAAVALYKSGFIPTRKLKRLIFFMVLCISTIYAVLGIGQMTMFYYKTQYFDPIKAVTLMTRYCAPANMGLLILLCSFASGQASDERRKVSLPSRRGLAAAIITGMFIFTGGAYTAMNRRFIHDPLDESRIDLRKNYCTLYDDFIGAIREIPLDQLNEERTRVLLCIYNTDFNPIVINEASPISFRVLYLSGDADYDMSMVSKELALRQERFFYVSSCDERFADALSVYMEDRRNFKEKALYEIHRDKEMQISFSALK